MHTCKKLILNKSDTVVFFPMQDTSLLFAKERHRHQTFPLQECKIAIWTHPKVVFNRFVATKRIQWNSRFHDLSPRVKITRLSSITVSTCCKISTTQQLDLVWHYTTHVFTFLHEGRRLMTFQTAGVTWLQNRARIWVKQPFLVCYKRRLTVHIHLS